MRFSLSRFGLDNRASIGIVAALAAIPLIAAFGAAVDYSRQSQTRAVLQQAADSAALAAAGLSGSNEAARKKYADDIFKAGLKGLDVNTFKSRGLNINAEKYEYSAVLSQKNVFMAAIGIDKTDVGVKAAAAMGVGNGGGGDYVFAVDSAALDVLEGCWDVLFNTLNDVLDVVKGSKWAPKTFASYFVFGDRVNVGTGKASWLTTPVAPTDWKGCLEPREELISGNPYTLTDASPTGAGRFKPSAVGHFLTPGIVDYYQALGHANPKPGCPQPMTGPTNSQSALTAAMKATPKGSVITTGYSRHDEAMAWAMRLLSKNWASAWNTPGYGASKNKAVVFVTAGFTRTYDYEVGGAAGGSFGPDKGSKAGFDNFLSICDKIKADGTLIYVIEVIPSNSSMLPYAKKCATSDKHFYNIGHFDPVAFRAAMRQLFAEPVFQSVGPRLIN
jgi:type II secretory pathway pseudopilin PulG